MGNCFNILYYLNYDLNDFLTYYDFVVHSFHAIIQIIVQTQKKASLARSLSI
jgi:hypothetical protein